MRSDSFRRADNGFTLIEVVVALAVVGLALTFILPRLTGWIDRLTLSLRQQHLEDSLNALGSRARRTGQTVILRSSGRGASNSAPEAVVELPRGWTLTVDPPIAFRYDGLCTGGTVHLSSPGGEIEYRLLAPYCRLQAL